MRSTITFTFVLIHISLRCIGQTCCSGGVPIGNNVGSLPMADSGNIQLALQFDINILKTLKEGNATIDDESRSRKTYSAIGQIGYSFSNRWSTEGLFSWVRQERQIRQNGGYHDFTFSQGVGDAVFLAKYKWWDRNQLKLILGAGPKFPFGRSDQKSENGITLNADLQPGTGATDLILTHNFEWTPLGMTLLNFIGNIVYRNTGTNKKYLQVQNYRFGNEFQIMTGIGRQFMISTQLFHAQAGLRYRSNAKDQVNGEILPNTGGKWMYGTGNIIWNVKPVWSLSFSMDIPLLSNVTGTQLSPTARFVAGGYYLIDEKEKSWKSIW